MNIIEKIEQVKGIKHSKEQLAILNHNGGMVVLAGAGSGKTSIITELLFKRIENGELDPNKLLCATYSKSGANEMEAKFNELCNKMGRKYKITVKTLHACYYQILKYFGYTLNICDDRQLKLFIKQALKLANINDTKDNDIEEYVINLIQYQVNRVLSDENLVESYLFDKEKLSKEQFIAVRTEFNRLKRENNVVDYDDLQLQVYNLLYMCGKQYEDLVLNYCRSIWDCYFIDEFQDTSTIQYKILKKFVSKNDADKLVVIGDDDQSIYQWRGTNPNIILEDVRADYNLNTFVLPTNYRCSSNIVDFAANSVKCLSKRQDKELVAFKEGGKVEILTINNDYSLYNMSKLAYDKIMDLVYKKGVSPDDIAVLCRNNNQVGILNNMLMNNGIYTNCTEGMKFTKTQLYNDFSCIFEFNTDTSDHNTVKKFLWKYVPYLGVNGATLVGELMNETGLTLKDTLGFLLSRYSIYDQSITKDYSKVKINSKIEAKIGYRFAKINRDAIGNLYTFYDRLVNDSKAEKDKMKELLWFCMSSISYLYKSPERARILKGYKDYFNSLLDTNSIDEIKQKFKVAEQIEKGSSAVLGDKVNLCTFHGSKGLEWKYVILFCCDNLVLPGFKDIKDMLDSGYSVDDVNTYIDCERRLYYVGCTRAKELLTIVGNTYCPSPFLLESIEYYKSSEENNESINKNYDIIKIARTDNYTRQEVEEYVKIIKEKYGEDKKIGNNINTIDSDI